MSAQGALRADLAHHDSMDGSTVHRRDYTLQSRRPSALSPEVHAPIGCPPAIRTNTYRSTILLVTSCTIRIPRRIRRLNPFPLPSFPGRVHAGHHLHAFHGAVAAHKALSHAPRTQTRSPTRLHMQHTGGFMRELVAVGIMEFCEQWATGAFVTPRASTNTRARIGGARDGPSGRPFGQSAWP